jgi:hypothetical protein
MPDAFTYHDGFELITTEPLRLEVLAFQGGPVTLTASTVAAVESIHLSPDQARRLALLLVRAAASARKQDGGSPPGTRGGEESRG